MVARNFSQESLSVECFFSDPKLTREGAISFPKPEIHNSIRHWGTQPASLLQILLPTAQARERACAHVHTRMLAQAKLRLLFIGRCCCHSYQEYLNARSQLLILGLCQKALILSLLIFLPGIPVDISKVLLESP